MTQPTLPTVSLDSPVQASEALRKWIDDTQIELKAVGPRGEITLVNQSGPGTPDAVSARALKIQVGRLKSGSVNIGLPKEFDAIQVRLEPIEQDGALLHIGTEKTIALLRGGTVIPDGIDAVVMDRGLPGPGSPTRASRITLLRGDGIEDIESLRTFTELEYLLVRQASRLRDILPLSDLKKLKVFSLGGANHVSSWPVQIALPELSYVDLDRCKKLIDIPGLQACKQLKTARIVFCDELQDIEGIGHCHALRFLNLEGCSAIHTPLEKLSELQSLKDLNLRHCRSLSDPAPIARFSSLQKLNLGSAFTGVSNLSFVSGLGDLRMLDFECSDLPSLDGLENCTELRSLQANQCRSLVDIKAIANLKSMTRLELVSALGSVLEDIQAIGHLSHLKYLRLSGHDRLRDIAPLASLSQLESLNLGSNLRLTQVDALSELDNLRELDLSGCFQIQAMPDLSRCTRLWKINLEMKPNFRIKTSAKLHNIGGLSGLNFLQYVNLNHCQELAESHAWPVLDSLPSLRSLNSSFPSHFQSRLLARAAATQSRWKGIPSQLKDWLHTARTNPTQPGLLTDIGRAAALNPAGHPALTELIGLAQVHESPEVEGLFEAACACMEDPRVASALQEAIVQAERPLPAEALRALHLHHPNTQELRNRTLRALQRTLSNVDANQTDAWTKTAHVLRTFLDGADCYPVDPTVHDEVFEAIADREFGELEALLFGSLASVHARSDDLAWSRDFHDRLRRLALNQEDPAIRNQALSEIVAGLALARDAQWGTLQLDIVLQEAARVDPDTSALQATIVTAHATAERWDAAEQAAFLVARPKVRDDVLVELGKRMLDQQIQNCAQRSLSLFHALGDPFERIQRLLELSSHHSVRADPVAYGQLVTVLAEHPEAQQTVVIQALKHTPGLNPSRELKEEEPVTEREHRLVQFTQNRRDEQWRQAISDLDPTLRASIEKWMETTQ